MKRSAASDDICHIINVSRPAFKDEHARVLSFAGKDRDIADPWYTGNFDQTYDDIMEGCTAFLKKLLV